MVDNYDHMISRMLFGQKYVSPIITLDLEHQMTLVAIQKPWLAQILIDNGNPSFLQGKERIKKSYLSFRENFGRP